MREPLKLPFIHLLFILSSTILLALLDLCWSWGVSQAGAHRFTFTYFLEQFPSSAFSVIVPAVVISTLLIGFRMARHPFSRLLGMVLVLAVSYLVMVNGMIWLGRLSSEARTTEAIPRQFVQPRTLVRLGSTVLAANTVAGADLGPTLVANPSRTSARLTVYPGGTIIVKDGTLAVRLTGGPSSPALSGAPLSTASSVFVPDRITAFFLRDIHTLTSDYHRLLDRSLPQFFAACFALLFLCSASLMLLRVTRWPLANVVLLAAAVRGYFSLYHLLAVDLAPQVAQAVADPLLVRLFPEAVMAGLAVVLLLVDILFVPARRAEER
ncbi:MAG TPA: hypothetical protein VFH83_13440, partial [Spirochaetia bacterium]|nr:hypothetical protein [Spirochaetia bacterium]